jgi:DedD protein
MGLLSIFKRRAESPSNTSAASAGPTDAVQRARTRARQRLIGAIVLVGIGVIGFPLVFETQPRPIPVDIPIEVPPKDGAPALVMPAARAPAAATKPAPASAAVAAPTPVAPTPNDVITESREDAGREIAPPLPSASAAVAPPAARAASKPVAAVAVDPVPHDKPADRDAAEAARAKALLDAKTAKTPTESGGRYVVQVGAFADAGAARETRLKAEKLGLKTYTQVAATSAGQRIRVRVGPFGTRDEADKALARARGAGLTAVVLTL